MANRVEWVVAELAVAMLGAVLVAVNTRLQAPEVSAQLRHARVRALLMAPRFAHHSFLTALLEILPELDALEHVVCVGEARPPRIRSWASVLEAGTQVLPARLAAACAAVGPEDALVVLYTTGTTAAPKGVLLSHGSALPHCFHTGEALALTPADRLCFAIPLFGTWGCLNTLLSALSHGTTVVLLETFEPRAVLATVARERCTVLHGVDAMFRALLAQPDLDQFDRRALRTGIVAMMAGANPAFVREIVERLGLPQLIQAFGMTEAHAGVLTGRVTDPLERRLDSVGRPAPGVEVRLVDPDVEREVGAGEVGELRVRGPNVMQGYLDDPAGTAAAFDADGWFRTGDLFERNVEGFYHFRGRLKELLKPGGFSVAPREIEETLLQHPRVREAYVVGVPDSRLGEVPMAFVIPAEGASPGAEELLAFCRARLANFKVPRYVRLVTDVPRARGPHGDKVQKPQLRELALRELGLSQGVPGLGGSGAWLR